MHSKKYGEDGATPRLGWANSGGFVLARWDRRCGAGADEPTPCPEACASLRTTPQAIQSSAAGAMGEDMSQSRAGGGRGSQGSQGG